MRSLSNAYPNGREIGPIVRVELNTHHRIIDHHDDREGATAHACWRGVAEKVMPGDIFADVYLLTGAMLGYGEGDLAYQPELVASHRYPPRRP